MYTPSQTSSYRSRPDASRSAFSRSSTEGSNTTIAIHTPQSCPRQLQFLRPHGHDRERAGRVRLEVLIDLLHRHRVDRRLDLFQRADAAADEVVVGDGAGAGAGGLALHDGAGLEAGLGAIKL